MEWCAIPCMDILWLNVLNDIIILPDTLLPSGKVHSPLADIHGTSIFSSVTVTQVVYGIEPLSCDFRISWCYMWDGPNMLWIRFMDGKCSSKEVNSWSWSAILSGFSGSCNVKICLIYCKQRLIQFIYLNMVWYQQ